MHNATINLRLDKKLKDQLIKYAERNDNGMASKTARKAIQQFLNEELIKLAEQAGLVYSGINADGQLEFIGENDQWNKYEQLKKLNNLI